MCFLRARENAHNFETRQALYKEFRNTCQLFLQSFNTKFCQK